MKNHLTLATLLTATLLTVAGCATESASQLTAPPLDVTVTVKCSQPRMPFTGTIVADGQIERLVGIGQGSFPAHGRVIDCDFKKTGDDGQITLEVTEAGQSLGKTTTSTPHSGVRARLRHTHSEQYYIFTTF